MKIVLAFDSFKGSLTADEAVEIAGDAIREWDDKVEISKVPVCDGGEGTMEILTRALKGEKKRVKTYDALMRAVEIEVGVIGEGKEKEEQTIVMETASVVGLSMLKAEERSPLRTTSYGIGYAVKSLIEEGYCKFTIGLGGSSTNDGGVGFMQGLGAICYDRKGRPLRKAMTGAEMHDVESMDFSVFDSRTGNVWFNVICDVDNPLCGERGAAYVYGPQKGASDAEVRYLDRGLRHISDVVYAAKGKKMAEAAHGGAAGGLGAALWCLVNGRFFKGIDYVLDVLDFNAVLEGADYVLSGEGSVDRQSVMGKALEGIVKRAKEGGRRIDVVAFGGKVTDMEILKGKGIGRAIQITPKGMREEVAMIKEVAKANLKRSVKDFFSADIHHMKNQ